MSFGSRLVGKRALVDLTAVTSWLSLALELRRSNDPEAAQLLLENINSDIKSLEDDRMGIISFRRFYGEPPLDQLQKLGGQIRENNDPAQIESQLGEIRATLEEHLDREGLRRYGAERR